MVGALPRHVQIGPTEMAVRGRLLEDWPTQVERLDDAGRAEVLRGRVATGLDLIQLAFIVMGISMFASLLGIWKAMNVEANTVLAT